jgi:7-cyano-7-deazaguanine synthase
MIAKQAVVLLSGGMDSVAVLHWAKPRYPKLVAFLFDYGQPNRDQELTAAGTLARQIGVPTASIVLADALPRGRGILKSIEDHDGLTEGLSPAFVPGRNLLFITSAAAHGSVHFPSGNFDIVIGANGQDAKRFPDCSHGALIKLSQALRHGVAREINVVAPYVDRTKEQILRSLDAPALEAVARSWSCYRNSGPCRACSACVLRREAFEAVGVVDYCVWTRLTGGDPARESV